MFDLIDRRRYDVCNFVSRNYSMAKDKWCIEHVPLGFIPVH